MWAWLVLPASGAPLAGTPGPNLLIKLCSISTPALLPVFARLFCHPVWYMRSGLIVFDPCSWVLSSANLSSVSLQCSSASQPVPCDHDPPVCLPTALPPSLVFLPINHLNLHLSQCSALLGLLLNQQLTQSSFLGCDQSIKRARSKILVLNASKF